MAKPPAYPTFIVPATSSSSSSGKGKGKAKGKGRKPPQTPEQKAATAAATANAKANSPAYLDAQAKLSAARKQASLDAHTTDPWVIPVTGVHGEIVGFRYVTGATPPKNVLKKGGEPLTKTTLTAVWNQYSSGYEAFTGKVASAADIVRVLKDGLSPMGMQQQLSKLPGFVNSPIYKSQSADVNAAAQALWGTKAPKAIIAQALAQNWDSATLQQHLRNDPRYLRGPEFLTNKATMKDAYQQIYGAPDENALQSISEAAANGWTTVQFADYLRSQPQYKTSIEYQSNAVNFLDAMGLFTGGHATLTPGAQAITGGTAVTNAPVVPGVAKPLNPELPFTPTLPGAPGLTGGANTSTPPPTAPGPGTGAGTNTLGQDRLAAGRLQRSGTGV